jgi:hypothetical protein
LEKDLRKKNKRGVVVKKNAYRNEFGWAPLSVIDTTHPLWQRRVRMWRSLGIKNDLPPLRRDPDRDS